jgi:hypothetical protein
MCAPGNSDAGGRTSQRVEASQDIGEWPKPLFEFPLDQFDGPGIQARTGQLSEVAAMNRAVCSVFDAREVDASFPAAADSLPGGFEFGGDCQFAGKDVDRAQGQDGQARALKSLRRVPYPIKDFVDGAIAAGGSDDFKAFIDRFSGETARIADRGC